MARLHTDPANQDATEALWATIAARYRDRAAVGGYDLLNEPGWERGADVAGLFERLTRWSRITSYLGGKGPRPTPDEAAAAVRAMLQAASVSRCRRNAQVIRILASS